MPRYIGESRPFAIGTTLRTYLDHAATTPMRPEAVAAVAEGMAAWANPSSPHAEGRAARAKLEEARARIAAALGWSGEVILTSGASEAIALALRRGGEVSVGATEHDAVLRAAPAAVRLGVDADGRLPRESARFPVRAEPVEARVAGRGAWDTSPSATLRTGFDRFRMNGGGGASGAVSPTNVLSSDLVAIQTANSETGVLQPPPDLAATWLADASQTAGKLPLPDADLIVVSAHKLGGPPGIGALLLRDLGLLEPTGGQERGYRGGTENLPGALGFAAALEAPRNWFAGLAPLRAALDSAVRAGGGIVVADEAPRIATIASYRMPGMSAAAQLIRFDMMGFAVSAGSACSSGSLKPSHVLAAMGMPADEAAEVIRVSFGWTTTADDVARFAEAWAKVARR